MKLFITNKESFSLEFQDEAPIVHKKAFTVLSVQIANNHIPIVLMCEYDDNDNLALFKFQKVLDDVYFYEFTGTAQ